MQSNFTKSMAMILQHLHKINEKKYWKQNKRALRNVNNETENLEQKHIFTMSRSDFKKIQN